MFVTPLSHTPELDLLDKYDQLLEETASISSNTSDDVYEELDEIEQELLRREKEEVLC